MSHDFRNHFGLALAQYIHAYFLHVTMTSSIKAPSALHKFVAVMADGINPTYPALSKVGTCEKHQGNYRVFTAGFCGLRKY